MTTPNKSTNKALQFRATIATNLTTFVEKLLWGFKWLKGPPSPFIISELEVLRYGNIIVMEIIIPKSPMLEWTKREWKMRKERE